MICNYDDDDVVTLKHPRSIVDVAHIKWRLSFGRTNLFFLSLRDAGRSSLAYRHADIPTALDRHFRFNSVPNS
jgi:hypothetical protein